MSCIEEFNMSQGLLYRYTIFLWSVYSSNHGVLYTFRIFIYDEDMSKDFLSVLSFGSLLIGVYTSFLNDSNLAYQGKPLGILYKQMGLYEKKSNILIITFY